MDSVSLFFSLTVIGRKSTMSLVFVVQISRVQGYVDYQCKLSSLIGYPSFTEYPVVIWSVVNIYIYTYLYRQHRYSQTLASLVQSSDFLTLNIL